MDVEAGTGIERGNMRHTGQSQTGYSQCWTCWPDYSEKLHGLCKLVLDD